MNKKELETHIINQYKQDEHMMVLVFAQWCVNHDLDPLQLYKQAYPDQKENEALKQAIDLTVPKEEAGHISDETLLNVLSLYGNEDLAFVVSKEVKKCAKKPD
ncbi:hypothetical protein [Domibacillus robiginosus]|uniref:hypothetical protein n=1 Tax=Domibacillus robiginosus TaxID=1071054 RepID=UPI00067D60C8|nr:hypothetical protein [Domibacillus robiginosus]